MPQHVVDQRVIAIYFDKERKVTRLANYGLKDGKVFDFISQTTPTGGQERSLLGGMLKFNPFSSFSAARDASGTPKGPAALAGPLHFRCCYRPLSAPAPPAAAAPRCW